MPIAAAVIGAGATLYASSKASKAAKNATNAQVDANNRAIDLQERMYDEGVARQAPWYNVGVGALGQIAGLYNLSTAAPGGTSGGQDWAGYLAANPDVKAQADAGVASGEIGASGQWKTPEEWAAFHYSNTGQAEGRTVPTVQPANANVGAANDRFAGFFASPDYEFRRSEGMRGIEGSAAAGGSLQSGGTLKALNQYNSNLAKGEFSNWYNRLASLAGVGQTAVSGMNELGQNYANRTGNLLGNIGDARASGYIGQAAANNYGVNALANSFGGIMGQFGGGGNSLGGLAGLGAGINPLNTPFNAVGSGVSAMPVQTNVPGLSAFNPPRFG